MTTMQFIAMIGEAETGGIPNALDRQRAIGDRGLASGFFQMHWVWRQDYWSPAAWAMLMSLDQSALVEFIQRHPGKTARELANLYNLGHEAADQLYDKRCYDGMATLGIPDADYDLPIED